MLRYFNKIRHECDFIPNAKIVKFHNIYRDDVKINTATA